MVDDELLTFTAEEFEDYEHELRAQQINDPNVTSAQVPPMMSTCTSDPLQDFQKGIHWDMSSFHRIKNIEQWDNWRWIFKTTAEAQVVSDVLDLKYSPSSPTKTKVFNSHQTYIYAILLNG